MRLIFVVVGLVLFAAQAQAEIVASVVQEKDNLALEIAKIVAPLLPVLAVGYLTYRVAREQVRVARRSVVMDLFDRRWNVYRQSLDAIDAAFSGRFVALQPQRHPREEMRNVMEQAEFLFGKEVIKVLETIQEAIEMRTNPNDDPDDIAFDMVWDAHEKLTNAVRPYMSFEDLREGKGDPKV